MALPLAPGLTPAEVGFLGEMEMVTVIPRQRLEAIELLGGSTPPLQPPHRANLPLWLALLLKRQRRANIVPPPWLHPASLQAILHHETELSPDAFSPPPPLPLATAANAYGTVDPPPPFVPSSATADAAPDALPYHWLELGEMLLDAAEDDVPEPERVRRLMRDLREVRMSKIRAGLAVLSGTGVVSLTGVGAMEVAESRAFVVGVVDGLRKIGASQEQARREREREADEEGRRGGAEDEDEDEEME
ncbi:MAG: DNA replication protein psf2 [Phylliscum demangeonii]|nr:MAG: DNA replication protein psf2 [Phylliscum demangeonii]